jgi:hypothetical protein
MAGAAFEAARFAPRFPVASPLDVGPDALGLGRATGRVRPDDVLVPLQRQSVPVATPARARRRWRRRAHAGRRGLARSGPVAAGAGMVQGGTLRARTDDRGSDRRLERPQRSSSTSSIQCRTGVGGAGLQVRDAADVGRDDGARRGLRGGERRQLAVAQRRLWPARAAAPSTCRPSRSTGGSRRRARGGRRNSRAPAACASLDAAAQLLPVLQRARRMEHQRRAGACSGDSAPRRSRTPCQLREQRGHQAVQELAQVAGERADASGLLGVVGVARQRVAVVLDRDAAARRVHHDGLHRARVGEPGHPGHQASMLRRMSSSRRRVSPPWLRTAPQQPAPSGDDCLDAGGRARAVAR